MTIAINSGLSLKALQARIAELEAQNAALAKAAPKAQRANGEVYVNEKGTVCCVIDGRIIGTSWAQWLKFMAAAPHVQAWATDNANAAEHAKIKRD